MNKLKCIIFIISILPVVVYGQNDYYTSDSITTAGIELVDGGDVLNSRLCQVKIDDKTVTYSPYEVKEYGFEDGRVYVSKEIQLSGTIERVFLERLNKGETTLYFYKSKGIKTFFLEKDSTLLLEIPRHDIEGIGYKKQLKDMVFDCQNVNDVIKLSSYQKESITELASRFNNCELKPFPHIRYGLTFGLDYMKFIYTSGVPNADIQYIDFKYDRGFALGLFIDAPVSMSDFSVHAEVNYSSIDFSYNKLIFGNKLDFNANISSLSFPLLLRYKYPFNKIRPFLNAGPIFVYNLKNENKLYKTTYEGNVAERNEILTLPLINVSPLWFSIGGGIEYNLNLRNSISFEFRYNKQLRQPHDLTLIISEFQLFTAISF